jgi:O-antigen ligase
MAQNIDMSRFRHGDEGRADRLRQPVPSQRFAGLSPTDDDTKAYPKSGWFLDVITIFWLVGPLMGTFFPPESYFARTNGQPLPYPITAIVLMFGSITAMIMYLRLRRFTKIDHEFSGYIIFLVALIGLSWSPSPAEAFNRVIRLLPHIVFGMIYAQYYSTQKFLRFLTIAFAISAVASIFMGLFVPSLGNANMGNGYERAWRGATGQKNAAGALYALAVMTIAIAKYTNAISWRLFTIAFVTSLITLILSQSATPLVGVCIAAPIALAINLLRKLPGGASVIIGLTSIAILASAILIVAAMPNLVIGLIGRDMTLTGRTDIWQAVWWLIQDNPIRGYGYAFWSYDTPARESVWQHIGYHNPHSHNSWLDIWLQLGIVGLLCLAWMMLKAFFLTFKLAVASKSRLGQLLIVFPIFFLNESLTEVVFSDPNISAYFWMTWVIITTRRELKRTDESSARSHSFTPAI